MMEQEPLRAFPTAHFSCAPTHFKTLNSAIVILANLLIDPRNQAPCLGSVNIILISKLRMQQVLFCIDTR